MGALAFNNNNNNRKLELIVASIFAYLFTTTTVTTTQESRPVHELEICYDTNLYLYARSNWSDLVDKADKPITLVGL